jgi:hypothetical protein
MAVFLSSGVQFNEIDLSTVIPAVSVSAGALAGVFRWGPVSQRFHIDSENTLVRYFGQPTNFNAETFFTAANFLSYANQLYVVRAANTSGRTPHAIYTSNTDSEGAKVFEGNTMYVTSGMYLTQASNIAIVPVVGQRITVTSANATHFVLSNAALANGSVELWFGNPQTSYSAVGIEVDGVVDNLVNQIVRNETDYFSRDTGVWANGIFHTAPGEFDSDVLWIAKYPGSMGKSLRVCTCDNANTYASNLNLTTLDPQNANGTVLAAINFEIGNNIATIVVAGNATNISTVTEAITLGDNILAGNNLIGFQYNSVTDVAVEKNNTANTTTVLITFTDPYRLHTPYQSTILSRHWEHFATVGVAPGQSSYQLYNGNTAAMDEMHVVVVDEGGMFSGTPGTVLETFKGISRATDAKNLDSSDNYYAHVINQNSAYIWWANDRSTAPSANAALLTSATSTAPGDYYMQLGTDGYDETEVSLSTLGNAWDMFVSPEDIDIGLILQGRPCGAAGATWQLANYLIQNIAQVRRDCVVCLSPDKNVILNQFGNEAMNLTQWRNYVEGSNYAVCDSGYKYQYDRYADIYRWIPLNGDIAGLCARTDQTNDPWWSPAGLNRGLIKNVMKLAYNPKKSDRDVLYPNGINPVITIPGTGTLLYGDKTLQPKPSAFDRINVRRLFITLEKAISLSAKYSLFEFNDEFTRNAFKNMVNPYLRQIQGRRGIYDFLVVCDGDNNTPAVIDANQFVGDIYIKPARSINWIILNFVAVATGVQFSEVVGKW